MSTVKHVLMVATEAIAAGLDIPYDHAANLIRDNEAVADTVLRELTSAALAIAEKGRAKSTHVVPHFGNVPEFIAVPLFVAACEGIALGSHS